SIAPHNFASAGSSSRSLTSLPGRVRLRVFLYLYYPHIMTNGGMSPRSPLLTFAILITLLQSLLAQDRPTTGPGGGTGRNIADHLLIQEANKTLYDAPEENVIGSPYLVRDFVKGNIRSSKGRFEGVEMRYNILQDVIECMQDNFTYILDPSPDIHLVDMGEYKLVAEKGIKNRAYGFYEVLD